MVGPLGNIRRADYLRAMAAIRLDDRAVLEVSGSEAKSFLQGLITNDVGRLKDDLPLYAALLTPQGKILFDFVLFDNGETVLVDCAALARDALQKRLSLYRLRAKVDLRPRADLAVYTSFNSDAAEGARDPRAAGLGRRWIAVHDSNDADAQSYLSHRLDLGVPEGADFGQDKVFALDGDLDELNAVSFDKGCYVGQELTARMKHRGTARKRLLPISSANGDLLPPADTGVTANGHEIGTLTSAYGPRGFALIRLDRLEDAGTSAIEANGIALNVTKPSWLFA
jgi:folate-binding protein YgfZ